MIPDKMNRYWGVLFLGVSGKALNTKSRLVGRGLRLGNFRGRLCPTEGPEQRPPTKETPQ